MDEVWQPVVSLFAAAAVLWLFEWNLRVLSPGAYSKSRWMYGVLLLLLSPSLWWAALTVPAHAQGLAFALAALALGMRALEQERGLDAAGFVLFAILAVFWQFSLFFLLVLPALALLLELWRRREWGWLIACPLLGVSVARALVRWRGGFSENVPWDWALANFFRNTFEQDEQVAAHLLPNIAYLLYPLAHPFFCLALPALFFLFKKTDVHLYSKRLLTLSLLVFLVFAGGLPQQELGRLLPAYSVLLLLLFPAWDRFFAYGTYFLPRLAYALIGLTVLCQVCGHLFFRG